MVGRDRSAAVASTAYFGIAGERGVLGYGLSVALGLAVAFVVWPHVHGTPQKMVSAGDVAASSSGSADAARAIPAFASFSNVTVAYYDIDATDAAAIKEQLGERGPHLHDAQFEGLTNWYYRWHWDPAPTGGCGAANANVSVEAHVVLPRLARVHSVIPRVARAWRSYMDALTRHEAGHIRIAYENRDVVANAVRSSSCSEANAAGERAIQSVRAAQAQYDDVTQHGRGQGVRLL